MTGLSRDTGKKKAKILQRGDGQELAGCSDWRPWRYLGGLSPSYHILLDEKTFHNHFTKA